MRIAMKGLATIGLAAAAFWAAEPSPADYHSLARAEAAAVTGGDGGGTTCPPQTFTYNQLCAFVDQGNCPDAPNPNNPPGGRVCKTPSDGPAFACSYNCTQQSVTGGSGQSAQGIINSAPCPDVPAAKCGDILLQGVPACACVPTPGYKAFCSRAGTYLSLSTCAAK